MKIPQINLRDLVYYLNLSQDAPNDGITITFQQAVRWIQI